MGATPQERDVLAELIRLNHEYEALPKERRAKFILSTDMRKEVREKLDIEEKQYNGLLSRLKKLKYLGDPIMTADGIVNDNLLFKADKDGIKIEIIMMMSQQPISREKVEEEVIQIEEIEEIEEEQVEPVQEEKKMAPPANNAPVYLDGTNDEDITIL
jgi:hypothetical protein